MFRAWVWTAGVTPETMHKQTYAIQCLYKELHPADGEIVYAHVHDLVNDIVYQLGKEGKDKDHEEYRLDYAPEFEYIERLIRRPRRKSAYRKKWILRLVRLALYTGLVVACVHFVGRLTSSTSEPSPSEENDLPGATTSGATEETTASPGVESKRYTEEEVRMVAQTLYGEARGCSREEQRLVVWCICNRVDNGYWGDTVTDVVTYPHQFAGYGATYPVWPELEAVAKEVLDEWNADHEAGVLEPYATTRGYLYFTGDGTHNWFRDTWR